LGKGRQKGGGVDGNDDGRTGVTLFLCGDVMTGRGIDQVLPNPVQPTLYEPYLRSALGYVELAEQAHGSIPRPVDFSYVWGDALAELNRQAPRYRIANLETSITTSEEPEPKGINYRMSPGNVQCLQVAGLDCCVLANNHVLDWGRRGLIETLGTLRHAGMATAGAGSDAQGAAAPAVLGTEPRVLVFGFCSPTSGVPPSWEAATDRPGVSFLADLSPVTAERTAERIRAVRRAGDIVVASIHWGENWGYAIPADQRAFAHALIDAGTVDLVHGHSSHHPKGIERYRERLILYGCGDFLNDYEGISGHEEYRADLVVAYFATLEPSGGLTRLSMIPFRCRRFRLERADEANAEWLRQMLRRASGAVGPEVELSGDSELQLVMA